MGSSLSDMIKKVAVGANDANVPTAVLFGTVTSVNPLEITVEQKLKLTKEFLILTKNVTDYTTKVTVSWETEMDINLSHNHQISEKKQITIHNALKINDNVILIRQQGGSNYIVLDKF